MNYTYAPISAAAATVPSQESDSPAVEDRGVGEVEPGQEKEEGETPGAEWAVLWVVGTCWLSNEY